MAGPGAVVVEEPGVAGGAAFDAGELSDAARERVGGSQAECAPGAA